MKNKFMGKVLAALLVMAFVVTSAAGNVTADAATKKITAKLYTTVRDWGETIDEVAIDMTREVDPKTVDVEDFSYKTTVTYFSYAVYSNVTEEVERTIKSVRVEGSVVYLVLETADSTDGHKYYSADSMKNAVVAYTGTVKDTKGKAFKHRKHIEVVATVNPQIDAFKECTTASGLNYRLFVPEDRMPERPLIVWLHGAGEMGTDNRLQIGGNYVPGFTTPEAQAYLENAFVLAPQSVAGGHNAKLVMEAIQDVMKEYSIDANRVYVGGCSMGGLGTVNMLDEYPTFFAAAFPICAAGTISAETAKAMVAVENPTAVYFIHSLTDGTCSPASSFNSYKNLIDAYAEKGISEEDAPVHAALFSGVEYAGLPEFIIPYMGHSSWVYVHNNFNCVGNDYDGKYFINSEQAIPGTDDSNWYTSDGKVFFEYTYTDTYYTYDDGEKLLDAYSAYLLPYTEGYDASKVRTVEHSTVLSMPSVAIRSLKKTNGTAVVNFFDWLADQSK